MSEFERSTKYEGEERTRSGVAHERIIDELDTLIACYISCPTSSAINLRSAFGARGCIRINRRSSRGNRRWCCFFSFPKLRIVFNAKKKGLHTWEPLSPVYFRLPLLNDLLCNIGHTFRLRGPQLPHCQPSFAFLRCGLVNRGMGSSFFF